MNNQHEDVVEKVLTGLQEIKPAPGLNDRVLRAMAQHSATTNVGTARRIGYALVLVAALIVAVVSPHLRTSPSAAVAHSIASTQSVLLPSIAKPALPPNVRTAKVSLTRRLSPVQQAIALKHSHAETFDELAIREMNAPTLPAPPLPLTAQEKLLLRVVRNGNPDEYALLNPDLRARDELKRRAQFPHVFQPEDLADNE